jgi:hypothetical protein
MSREAIEFIAFFAPKSFSTGSPRYAVWATRHSTPALSWYALPTTSRYRMASRATHADSNGSAARTLARHAN